MLTFEGVSRHGAVTREIDGPTTEEPEEEVVAMEKAGLEDLRPSRVSIRREFLEVESPDLARLFSQMSWYVPNLLPPTTASAEAVGALKEAEEESEKDKVAAVPPKSSSTNVEKPKAPLPLRFRYRRDGDICSQCNVIKCPDCPFLHEVGRCFALGKECNHCHEMDHDMQKCPKRREEERLKKLLNN